MKALLLETVLVQAQCKQRVEGGVEELKNLMSEYEDSEEIKEKEEWIMAE